MCVEVSSVGGWLVEVSAEHECVTESDVPELDSTVCVDVPSVLD